MIKWGVGVEKIDIPAATEAGVIVANSPGNSFAVAEATMLLILAVAKNLLIMTQAAKEGIRPAFDVRGHELYQKTLGIIGFGRIGRHLAHIAQGFDMSVLSYDPYVPPDRLAAVGAKQVDLPTLLRESDYVSVNCVLTPETHHLIGEEELALMKPTAYLVNTARGPIVEEAALYRALVEGRIAGAGLDVFEDEPLKPTNPLLGLPNVVATPHALSRAWESTARTTQMIQDAVLAILEGRLPDTILNPNVKSKGGVQ
jgi:phosphoglycerate dehydrogenase-like enzyme